MAWPTVDLARVADALPTLVQDDIIETMNRSCPELQLIRYKPVAQKNLQWDVEFKNASESSNSALTEGADVSTFGDDDIVPAVLQFCDYSEAIKVTGKSLSAARGSAGKGAGASELQDLWTQKMLRAVRRLAKNIGRDFWTGPGTGNRMLGLYGGSTLTSGAPLAAAGTYAGILRSTYNDWQGNVLATGGAARPLTFDLLRDMRREIYEACGEMPDLIMCDPTQHEAYGKLFGDQRRYVQEITIRGQKIVLDGGYRALEFDGIPIIMSVNHPAGSMTFLNTSKVYITALDDSPSEANRSPRMVQLQAMPEEQLNSGAVPLQARLNPLAVNGDAYPIQMILYPQIQVEQPNTCGVLADLNT
jgi:hypothetical protein